MRSFARTLLPARFSESDACPLEWPALRQPRKVPLICGYDNNSLPRRTHRNEGIVGQAGLPHLLVAVSGSKPGQHGASLRPIITIWHEYAPGTVEVSLQTLDNAAVAPIHAGVQFFKHHGAEPYLRFGPQLSQGQSSVVSRSERCDVNRRIEEDRAHLLCQLAVDVPDFDSAPQEPFVSLASQAVPFVFGNGNVKRPFDGLRFSARFQEPLCALDLGRVQPKVLMGDSISSRPHVI